MTKRERYIDIVKGLSIVSIVLLHYETGVFPGWLNVFIGSYMISAFYVAVGWVHGMSGKKPTLKELAAKRWQQLGKPYLWWTAIILLFDSLLWAAGYYDTYFMAREVYKSLILRGIGTLWFLPALFFGELMFAWLRKKNKLWLFAMALVLTVLYQNLYYSFFSHHSSSLWRIIDAPFKVVSEVGSAWLGIAFGYFAYKLTGGRIKTPLQQLLSGTTLIGLAFVCANYLPRPLGPFWGLLAPLIGPLGFILLIRPIQHFRIFDFLDYWGRNSLVLMVTHYSITCVIISLIAERLCGLTFDGWTTLVCFAVSMPVQYLAVRPIDKYIGFTLGKIKKQ